MTKIEDTKDWDWFVALYLWHYNELAPLSSLVKEETIPASFKPAIVSIVVGEYQPNKRSASKLTHSPSLRLKVLVQLYNRLGEIKELTPYSKEFYALSRQLGLSPEECLKKYKAEPKIAYKEAAKSLGITTRAIRSAYNDFLKLLAPFH
jgi:hypothetical protein